MKNIQDIAEHIFLNVSWDNTEWLQNTSLKSYFSEKWRRLYYILLIFSEAIQCCQQIQSGYKILYTFFKVFFLRKVKISLL